jgi:hypothetical protein
MESAIRSKIWYITNAIDVFTEGGDDSSHCQIQSEYDGLARIYGFLHSGKHPRSERMVSTPVKLSRHV